MMLRLGLACSLLACSTSIAAQKADFAREFNIEGIKPGLFTVDAIGKLRSSGFTCVDEPSSRGMKTFLGDLQTMVNSRYPGTYAQTEKFGAAVVRCNNARKQGIDLYLKSRSYLDGIKILWVSAHFSYRFYQHKPTGDWIVSKYGKPTSIDAKRWDYCGLWVGGVCRGYQLVWSFHNATSDLTLSSGLDVETRRNSDFQKQLSLEYQKANGVKCSKLRNGC